jgi:hypothetical protein
MGLNEAIAILDGGGTIALAMLVWYELKTMRIEMTAVLHRIDGFIQASSKED